ncbi:hypothetical protein GCM10010357_42690 [Streptomyces luteireticuli]|uniref:Uncharacterized protein n=1 Tax=Streptomyces luteireticuli TaxID=173858 RepID=A0ABN0YXE0_9ACTN
MGPYRCQGEGPHQSPPGPGPLPVLVGGGSGLDGFVEAGRRLRAGGQRGNAFRPGERTRAEEVDEGLGRSFEDPVHPHVAVEPGGGGRPVVHMRTGTPMGQGRWVSSQ